MIDNQSAVMADNKQDKIYKIVLIFLLISGASGLIYQVVWSKILLYVFGNSVYSATAVVASFMLGLGLGSILLGKLADKTKNKLAFYGILELLIALLSWLGYYLISHYVYDIYKLFYHDPSASLLVIKFALASMVVFVPAFFMGGTFPVVLSFFSKQDSIKSITSKLYGINTLGAVIGAILTGFLFLELIGIRYTFYVAMTLNIIVGLYAILISKKQKQNIEYNQPVAVVEDTHFDILPVKHYKGIVLMLFFVSGFLSLSYEIIWLRLFSPIIGNFTYSFSSILIVFLFGIAIGSCVAKKGNIAKPFLVVGISEMVIGWSSVGMLWIINNFNTTYYSYFILERYEVIIQLSSLYLLLLLSTLLMGFIFPLIYEISFIGEGHKKVGSKGGMLYAVNTAGSVIGIFLTGLLFLSLLGGSRVAFLFAIFNCLIGIAFILLDKTWLKQKIQQAFVYGGLVLVIIFFSIYLWNGTAFDTALVRDVKMKVAPGEYFIGHDLEAEVVAYRDEKEHLKVNGVGMTHLTVDTKMMTHLPMFLNPQAKNMLNIAVGMGTTYRSAIKAGLQVDAVELIPSVPEALYVFHPDAEEIFNSPQGHIYINDGYNYVSLVDKKYDIITVDPPPPVNSVGTTVLYSKEFYQQSQRVMNEDGIFVQWVYSHMKTQDALIIIKTYLEAFPYVSIWDSLDSGGVYLVGSFKPLQADLESFKQTYARQEVAADINEWLSEDVMADDIFNLQLDKQCFVDSLSDLPIVKNDKPIIEYYLWRRLFTEDKGIFLDFIESCKN